MSIANTQELLDVVAELTTIREMKVALNVTAQCGLMCAVSTMVGGLIAGPPGIAVGGLIGTAISSYHANGKFKSVPEILAEHATDRQKEKLADALRNLLAPENILTIVQLVAAAQNNALLMQSIQKVVRDFLISDMGYNCVL